MAHGPVQPGEILAGKYQVERVLGVGGMGVVVAARHLALDQHVALKFLLPEALANQETKGRFLREARNAVRLKSEHVARIIDVGTLENGSPYIVMEFLEGSDLESVLRVHGRLPVSMAVDYVLQACDAIAEAHALGIVHRDLKPPNLFLTRGHDSTGLIKVLDFGISKSSRTTDSVATGTQVVLGSPAYMSPEQMRSTKQVDARTDIWSLGVILYQLVSGRVPFEGETFTDLCLKVYMDPAPALPPHLPLPEGFERVVRTCLEKEPAQRYADVHELALALTPYAPAHALALVERIGRVVNGGGDGAWQQRSTGPQAAPQRGRRGLIAAAVALLVGAGVAVAAMAAGGQVEPQAVAADAGVRTVAPTVDAAPAPTPTLTPAPTPDAAPARVKPTPTPTPTPTRGKPPRAPAKQTSTPSAPPAAPAATSAAPPETKPPGPMDTPD